MLCLSTLSLKLMYLIVNENRFFQGDDSFLQIKNKKEKRKDKERNDVFSC